MSADPSSSPALRASDADRDRVIELLHAAAGGGRFEALAQHAADLQERCQAHQHRPGRAAVARMVRAMAFLR
jgi:hypothetical protein